DFKPSTIPNLQDEVMPADRGIVAAAAREMKMTEGDLKEPEPVPEQEEPRIFFDITVQKTGPDDRLGMDVKHLPGSLEVVTIFPDCAVERTNLTNKARSPEGPQLVPGDIIHKINGVENNDRKMVEQCRSSTRLEISASRVAAKPAAA
ncbi:unnamed protein product, partial [Polarella glacialis]